METVLERSITVQDVLVNVSAHMPMRMSAHIVHSCKGAWQREALGRAREEDHWRDSPSITMKALTIWATAILAKTQ